MFEDDLIPVLESCGQLYDMRIMMDSTTGGGGNRGYGFAMFVNKDAAKQAVEKVCLGFKLRYSICLFAYDVYYSSKTPISLQRGNCFKA